MACGGVPATSLPVQSSPAVAPRGVSPPAAAVSMPSGQSSLALSVCGPGAVRAGAAAGAHQSPPANLRAALASAPVDAPARGASAGASGHAGRWPPARSPTPASCGTTPACAAAPAAASPRSPEASFCRSRRLATSAGGSSSPSVSTMLPDGGSTARQRCVALGASRSMATWPKQFGQVAKTGRRFGLSQRAHGAQAARSAADSTGGLKACGKGS
mmetsp:Transcript_16996/g.55371  ORF Transcript_16996/g.55371 Transcript_16996/m.55371 type:complete len:215 (-) Transcript_16996:1263-1907(-)